MKEKLLRIAPHALIVIIIIALSSLYFYPVFEGKSLSQMDLNHAKGMANELTEFEKNNNGEISMWSSTMFSGMPAYHIKVGGIFNIFTHIQRFLRLFLPYTTVALLFIYLFGFYLLLTSLKMNKWLSLVGATAFAFSSYNIIIIAAGHITKAYAIAYMAPVVAGFLLTFEKKYWVGAILTTVALGVEISCSHPQITYYLALMLGILWIIKLVYAILEKTLREFGKATGLIAIAAVLALLPNLAMLWLTSEYTAFSTRGKSELKQTEDPKSSGLDKGYAFDWSYGVSESLTLLIPNAKGGATGALADNKDALKKADSQWRENIAGQNHYWGDQPFTSGPVYVGAIICFLFVLGLFVIKGQYKWWLLIATILSLMWSWGKNFDGFNSLFFYYFPYFNKFRSVSMALVIAGFTMPLLAMLTVWEIIQKPQIIKSMKKYFFISLGITAGLSLLLWLLPDTFMRFTSFDEAEYFASLLKEQPQSADQINTFITNLEAVRIAIFKADAIRSVIFILLSSVLLWFSSLMKKEYLIVGLGILMIIDMWIIDRRYLSTSDFKKTKQTNEFVKTTADELILKDTDPHYRVLNLTRNVFNDGITPYYHKTIGGYHGAKMRRYQELIDKYLRANVMMLQKALKENAPDDQISKLIENSKVINMLNTKYIIDNPNTMPLVNFAAYGNAWFINNFELVDNADQELETLGKIQPSKTAVINKNHFPDIISKLPKNEIFAEDTGKIFLTQYKPNHLIYTSITQKERFVVFSEIYYPKGWDAYIDNQPAPHICVNYVLRGMIVPSGTHKIEFKFAPKTFDRGRIVSLIGSIVVIIIVFGACVYFVIQEIKNNKEAESITIKENRKSKEQK